THNIILSPTSHHTHSQPSFPTRRSSDLVPAGHHDRITPRWIIFLKSCILAGMRRSFRLPKLTLGGIAWILALGFLAFRIYPQLRDRKSTRLNSSHVKSS